MEHTRISFLPDWKTIEWHHTREEFIGPIARPHMKIKPEFKGAISPDGKRWMVWNRDYLGEPLLYVLRIARLPLDPEEDLEKGIEDMADLLRAASAESEKWGLNRIIIWNPDMETLEAAARLEGVEFEYSNRDVSSIPCLKMHEDLTDEVEWIGNEKYTWC